MRRLLTLGQLLCLFSNVPLQFLLLIGISQFRKQGKLVEGRRKVFLLPLSLSASSSPSPRSVYSLFPLPLLYFPAFFPLDSPSSDHVSSLWQQNPPWIHLVSASFILWVLLTTSLCYLAGHGARNILLLWLPLLVFPYPAGTVRSSPMSVIDFLYSVLSAWVRYASQFVYIWIIGLYPTFPSRNRRMEGPDRLQWHSQLVWVNLHKWGQFTNIHMIKLNSALGAFLQILYFGFLLTVLMFYSLCFLYEDVKISDMKWCFLRITPWLTHI